MDTFFPDGQVSPSHLAPIPLAEDTRIAQPSPADATGARRLEKPVIPRHTRRTWPYAVGIMSCWETSLIVYRLDQPSFVRSFIFFSS